MTRPRISLVAAVAKNGVIGRAGKLPWGHFPEDMAHFQRLTMGHAVLMGRGTWDSLPMDRRPLPGRRNVVLSSSGMWCPGAEVCTSLPQALALLAHEPVVYVIGGAQLYARALPLADEIVRTRIDREFEGDAYFPPPSAWLGRFAGMSLPQVQKAAPPNDFTFVITTIQLRRDG